MMMYTKDNSRRFHGLLARWIKWRACDVGEAEEGLFHLIFKFNIFINFMGYQLTTYRVSQVVRLPQFETPWFKPISINVWGILNWRERKISLWELSLQQPVVLTTSPTLVLSVWSKYSNNSFHWKFSFHKKAICWLHLEFKEKNSILNRVLNPGLYLSVLML